MKERLVDALVGILVLDVLADEVNGDLVGRIPDPLDEIAPVVHARVGDRQAQPLQQDLVEPLFGQIERHLVDARDVARRDDRFFVDVAKERDLALQVVVERPIGPAEQDIRLDADRSEVADAVLRRLGLELTGRGDERHQRQVDVDGVVAADVLAELANRLEKRQALDVADSAADLHEQDVHVLGGGTDALLDLVRDVRDDLHRPSEVVAAPLFLNDRQVDLAGRPVVVARGHHVGEALVVAEIEIGLRAVVGDIDLTVLVRAHRAGIDVDVRVALLEGHLVATPFEETAD